MLNFIIYQIIFLTILIIVALKKYILNGGWLLYNIVVVFAIHQHESALGVHVFPHSKPRSHLPSHPIPLGCPRALALSALLHASNLHWSPILYMVIYMFQYYSLKSSHPHLLPQSIIIAFKCILLSDHYFIPRAFLAIPAF